MDFAKTLKELSQLHAPTGEEDEVAEVSATLRSGWLGTGPKVHQFENVFKEYTGAQHAMALNSCTGPAGKGCEPHPASKTR